MVWYGLRIDLARAGLPTAMSREVEMGKSLVLPSVVLGRFAEMVTRVKICEGNIHIAAVSVNSET